MGLLKKKSARHEQALNLKQQMDEINKQHHKHINDFLEFSKTANYKKDRIKHDRKFAKEEKALEIKEDKAYEKYYNHMHKDFDINNSSIDFTKYPEKFIDKKYINDMYKAKESEKNVKKQNI